MAWAGTLLLIEYAAQRLMGRMLRVKRSNVEATGVFKRWSLVEG